MNTAKAMIADGNCYEVAALIILRAAFNNTDAQRGLSIVNAMGLTNLHLVHGTVTRKPDGLEHSHAWIEGESKLLGRMCIDHANGRAFELPAEVYYALGKIKNTKRYKKEEARSALLKAESYGPWQLTSTC